MIGLVPGDGEEGGKEDGGLNSTADSYVDNCPHYWIMPGPLNLGPCSIFLGRQSAPIILYVRQGGAPSLRHLR